MITDKEFYDCNRKGLIYNKIYFYIISNDYVRDIQKCMYRAITMVQKELRQNITDKPNIAVIDLDETFLFNDYYLSHTLEAYRYNNHIQKFYKEQLDKKYGPVVPFMIIVYEYLVKKGIHVFFLTARNNKFKEDTVNNLALFNITNYSICFKKNDISSAEYKKRELRNIEDNGWNIVLCLNDQKEFEHRALVNMPQLYTTNHS